MRDLPEFIALAQSECVGVPTTPTVLSRPTARLLRVPPRLTQVVAVLLSSLCSLVYAQGGPPFKTDDPETPGNKHWEINLGWMGERSAGEGSYCIPNVDLNYGLGDRIQLKFELPMVIHEVRESRSDAAQIGSSSEARLDLGVGESLLGVKWRFYEHRTPSSKRYPSGDEPSEPNFSISTYPQLSLNNPTSSVEREVVSTGPQFLLPIEANARIGPIRIAAEVGYWFTNRNVPQSWIRGITVGHEFTTRTDAYVEIYDQQETNRVNNAPKGRQATLGLGGRHALNSKHTMSLLLMGGRSFQKVAASNLQPGWAAYIGMQFLFGPR